MTDWDKLPLTLTIAEAAEIARVTPKRMSRSTQQPDFPARRFGRRIVISTEGLRNWLANGWRTPSGASTITATR
jgi:hypothetical protein